MEAPTNCLKSWTVMDGSGQPASSTFFQINLQWNFSWQVLVSSLPQTVFWNILVESSMFFNGWICQISDDALHERTYMDDFIQMLSLCRRVTKNTRTKENTRTQKHKKMEHNGWNQESNEGNIDEMMGTTTETNEAWNPTRNKRRTHFLLEKKWMFEYIWVE